MPLVSQHTFLLAQMVYKELSRLRHWNGQPVCVLYHDSHFDDVSTQGGVVNLNILDPDGEFVGYSQVSLCCCNCACLSGEGVWVSWWVFA